MGVGNSAAKRGFVIRPSWWAMLAMLAWLGVFTLWNAALGSSEAVFTGAVYETVMVVPYGLLMLVWALRHREQRMTYLATRGAGAPQPDERRLALAVGLVAALMAVATPWLTGTLIRLGARFPKAEWDTAIYGAWIWTLVFSAIYRRYPAALRPNPLGVWAVLFSTSLSASLITLLFDPARLSAARTELASALQQWAHAGEATLRLLAR